MKLVESLVEYPHLTHYFDGQDFKKAFVLTNSFYTHLVATTNGFIISLMHTTITKREIRNLDCALQLR